MQRATIISLKSSISSVRIPKSPPLLKARYQYLLVNPSQLCLAYLYSAVYYSAVHCMLYYSTVQYIFYYSALQYMLYYSSVQCMLYYSAVKYMLYYS